MSELVRPGLWIDGENPPGEGDRNEIVNPATGTPWALATDATATEVDAAVAAARRAFLSSEWHDLSPTERGAMLRRLGDLLAEESQRLARIETTDNGKPLWQTTGELGSVPQWYWYFAGAADKVEGSVVSVSATVEGVIRREPVGVVAILTPFNSPLTLGSWKVAPALAAGNTVVIKPSPDTPVSSIELGRIAKRAGFPDGVINVVTGGAETGERLVTHDDVAMVSFTGSSQTAARIAASVAPGLKRCVLEGGGKSPHIVFADANLDQAVVAAASGVFAGTGQTCVAGSRLLVEKPVYDRFVTQLSSRADRLRVGDPLSPDTHLGPLTSQRQLERTSRFVEEARSEGAEIVAGGTRPIDHGREKGYYYRPTVVTGADSDSPICQEEVFGPVAAVLPFDTEEEAVRLANNTRYGLAAGVWSNDIRRCARLRSLLEAGTVWVNCYRAFSWQVPFGGRKASGVGRENGLEALREFTHLKSTITDSGETTPDPFGLDSR